MAPDDFDDRWVEPDTIQRTHFYGCPVIAYETMYIGLLWIFRAEDDRGYFHGPSYVELVTSRDGIHWERHDDIFFDRNPDPNAWDRAMTWIGYFSFRTYGNWRRDDYVNYAAVHANARLEGKSDEFLSWVGFYENIRDFNNLGPNTKIYPGQELRLTP